ncbi:TPA: hypothetical protein DCX16_01890 [bacterium]|nr:hypothetical protein [bacterium]
MRILLVDDDEGIRKGWKRAFEREGWEVTTAGDEKEVKNIIRRESSFDVAIVDMCLSPEDTKGKEGLNVIGLINEKDTSTQVIAVSTYMSEWDVAENVYNAMRFGIYLYMSKIMPNLLERLLEEIKNTRIHIEERDKDLEQGIRKLIENSERLSIKNLTVTQKQLDSALEKKKKTKRSLYGILIEMGIKEYRIKWILHWYREIDIKKYIKPSIP